MESEVWQLLNHLIVSTVSQSAITELEKIRNLCPSNVLMTQNVVNQFASFFKTLDWKSQQQLRVRVLNDIATWIKQIWHYSFNCLHISSGNSNDNLAIVSRMAIQEAWFCDNGSPVSSLLSPSNKGKSMVIYLSPAAPTHLRRWLSLNLCCTGLLITNLPSSQNSDLPTIDVSEFLKIVQKDVQFGRQPLLLIAYAGSFEYGSSDNLEIVANICQQFKMRIHIEGFSFLNLALLSDPPTNGGWTTCISSVNLELSTCVGLSQSISLILLRSTLPNSILLYLNVFPIEELSSDLNVDCLKYTSLSRIFSSHVSECFLTWITLRLQDGHSEGIGARLRHANDLQLEVAENMEGIDCIQVLEAHSSEETSTVLPLLSKSTDDVIVSLLNHMIGKIGVTLFRHSFKTAKSTLQMSYLKKQSISNCIDEEITNSLDNSIDTRRRISSEDRFLNGLNKWLANALQFEHPNLGIQTVTVNGNEIFLRFSSFDVVNLMEIKQSYVDSFIQNLKMNCAIMEATWQQRKTFRALINCSPGLFYYHLPDWAGLGAAIYVPHAYRSLFPAQNDAVNVEFSDQNSARCQEEDLWEQLTAALYRLPSNAAVNIAEVNRDLIARLRNHDFAFSSVRINFTSDDMIADNNSEPSSIVLRGSSSFAEVLDPLTNGRSKHTSGSTLANGKSLCEHQPPITTVQLTCLRFGLITPGTDIEEMIQLVLRIAQTVEMDSKYVNTLSDVVKRGIEEATNDLKMDHLRKISQEGVLRQVPYLDKLINWWYPPSELKTHGRTLNLSIGEVISTESICAPFAKTFENSNSQPSPSTIISLWNWLPFVNSIPATKSIEDSNCVEPSPISSKSPSMPTNSPSLVIRSPGIALPNNRLDKP